MTVLQLKKVIAKNGWFFIPYCIAIVPVIFLLVTTSKGNLHLLINQYHTKSTDILFRGITNMGGGLFAVAVALLFFFRSVRKGVYLVSTYIISGIAVQVLKMVIFPGIVRPVKYFQGIHELHLIDGVQMHYYHSFPSGHSATAFAMFLCLAFFSEKNILKFACLIGAILVAWSRVYLSQHFLADAFTGSLIGVITSLLLYEPVFLSSVSWLSKIPDALLKRKRNG